MFEEKQDWCLICSKSHCVNKGTGKSEKGFVCFVPSQCGNCMRWFYCQNPMKDKIPEGSPIYEEETSGTPTCFVEPDCNNCPLGSGHCKNKHLPDVKFSLHLEKSLTPDCYSGHHSYR